MDASTQTSPSAAEHALFERYADLLVGFGANVRPGQVVEVRAGLEKAALVHAVAASAYRHGARFVDVNWFDPWVRRARIERADPETLSWIPPWQERRVAQLGELRCARISLGPTMPREAVEGLDPALAAREPFPMIPGYFRLIEDRSTNWVGAAVPVPWWAAEVHPELPPDEALATLWREVAHVCRLDEDDPVAAWEARFAELERAERALNERRFDALRFRGPGTDLTVGLLPSSTWRSGYAETADGIRHASNVPTEEVFTAPDPARTEGVATATKPLVLKSGVVVRGLRVRFERGRAVEIDADDGAEALRTMAGRDEGAARLGEVALVDGTGRIGPLGTVFYETLLDENAASHVALGSAYLDTVGEDDAPRANRSEIHVDFMVGSDEVVVTGLTQDGAEVPVLERGAWRI